MSKAIIAIQVAVVTALILIGVRVVMFAPSTTSTSGSQQQVRSTVPGGDSKTIAGGHLGVSSDSDIKTSPPKQRLIVPFELPENAKRVEWLPAYANASSGWLRIDGLTHKWEVVHERKPRAMLLHDVLTDDECESMVNVADKVLERSSVIDLSTGKARSKVDSYRTSSGMFFQTPDQEKEPANMKYRRIIRKAMGLQEPWIEKTQVLRYNTGEYYKPHEDYFAATDSLNINRGGQRIATSLLTLREAATGGETEFPNANFKVKVPKRAAIIFYDVDESGAVEPFSMHAGLPPGPKSEKWAAVLWAHPRPFF